MEISGEGLGRGHLWKNKDLEDDVRNGRQVSPSCPHLLWGNKQPPLEKTIVGPPICSDSGYVGPLVKRLFIQRGQLTITMGFPPLLGGEECGVGMSPGHLEVRLAQQVRPAGWLAAVLSLLGL